MIERAIENWLAKTNERNYQIPFCQALAAQGHKVIYISADRPLEQGKDIITIGPDKVPCAYQLKSGNIGQNRWRNEIRPEIIELIEASILHPNIPRNLKYRSYLVLNGGVSDEVRIAINQLNEDNRIKRRKSSHLEVIDREQLMHMFTEVQGRFVPKTLKETKPFLELFVVDGRGMLDKALLASFLNNLVFDKKPRQRSEAINAISSSVILLGYALNEYQACSNHYAIFEAWTVLGGAILRYSAETKLKEKEWRTSFDLVMREIRRALEALFNEASSRKDFVERPHMGDGGTMYRTRMTLVLGACAALAIDKHELDEHGCVDKNITDFVTANLKLLWIWGESALSPYFSVLKLLEVAGHEDVAVQIIKAWCEDLLRANAPLNKIGLPTAYYSAEEVLAASFGLEDEIDFSSFPGSSSCLKSLVSMLARRDRRDFIAARWKPISRILIREFIPRSPLDALAWRTNKGINTGWFPKQTQSWRALKRAAQREARSCPRILAKNRAFTRFHSLVMPHRASDSVLSLLDT